MTLEVLDWDQCQADTCLFFILTLTDTSSSFNEMVEKWDNLNNDLLNRLLA